MRLFFFHSSKAKKGFRREIDPKVLDFYSKRSDHSAKNRGVLTNSVFWFSLCFVLQVGLGSLFMIRSLGTLDMDIERLSTGITIPGALNVTKIVEKRLLLNVVIKMGKSKFQSLKGLMQKSQNSFLKDKLRNLN